MIFNFFFFLAYHVVWWLLPFSTIIVIIMNIIYLLRIKGFGKKSKRKNDVIQIQKIKKAKSINGVTVKWQFIVRAYIDIPIYNLYRVWYK